MSQHETRIARDLLDEPRVRGRRVPVLTILERVEGRKSRTGSRNTARRRGISCGVLRLRPRRRRRRRSRYPPYVLDEELIVIIADVKNFAGLDPSRHEGVFFLNNQCTSAFRIANAILELVERYGSPDHMNGKIENLDKWIRRE